MRCLSPAGVAIRVDAQEYEAASAGGDEELHSEYVEDGELDVAAWARDQIALEVPNQILCRPDCAGLCPVCGKDLNVEPHDARRGVGGSPLGSARGAPPGARGRLTLLACEVRFSPRRRQHDRPTVPACTPGPTPTGWPARTRGSTTGWRTQARR